MAIEKRTLIWIVALLIASVLILHLLTLAIYPIPWFDETYFASISKSLLEQGKFYPTVGPLVNHFKEVYGYGPLYFLVQACFIKIFGFGSFAARFSSFIFLLSAAYYFVKIFLRNKENAHWFAALLLIAFFFDYTIFENVHMGRMELMALTFVFGYTYFILKNQDVRSKQQYYFNTLLYSLFAALAILSTPRSGILLVPPGIIMLYQLIKYKRKEQLAGLVISIVVFSILFLAWVQYSFGGVQRMLYFYRMVSESQDIARPFSLKDSFFVYQYPVVLLAIIFSIAAIKLCGKSFFDQINIISILSIILFYTFVRVHQAYTTYSIPYFYLIIINSLYKIYQAPAKKKMLFWANFSVYSLLLLMIATTAAKAYYIYDSRKERNPKEINSFVAQHIPPGSKVVGDDMYYFSVLNSGSDFQYMGWFDVDSVREKYQRGVYNYDYLIISDIGVSFQPKFFRLYNKKAKLELIGRFNPPVSRISSYIDKHRPGLISFFTYNGYLYRRIKD